MILELTTGEAILPISWDPLNCTTATESPNLLQFKIPKLVFLFLLFVIPTHTHAHGGQLGLCSSLSASLGDIQHCSSLLQKEERRGKHTLSLRTHCLSKLPHGKDAWDLLSHFISQSKSHGSAWVQGDGYQRLVVQSTTFSFHNKLGTWCVKTFFSDYVLQNVKCKAIFFSLVTISRGPTWNEIKM